VIRADAAQIEQALINLVHNAVDAALETHGEVSRSGGARKKMPSEIFVQDDRARDYESCEPFRAVFHDQSRKASGIGLPLSRQIAEAHGGSLALTNRKGGHRCGGFAAVAALGQRGSKFQGVSVKTPTPCICLRLTQTPYSSPQDWGRDCPRRGLLKDGGINSLNKVKSLFQFGVVMSFVLLAQTLAITCCRTQPKGKI